MDQVGGGVVGGGGAGRGVGGSGNPYRALEERRGFVDVRVGFFFLSFPFFFLGAGERGFCVCGGWSADLEW